MEALKRKIREEGTILSPSVIKVDAFLNHCIEPSFMQEIGEVFADKFNNEPVTKIITLESSGIAPATMTGLILGVPVIFLRKQKSLTMQNNLLTATVYSYTKQTENTISIAEKYLSEKDHVLIIDDLLANGEALQGMVDIVQKSDASLAGCGVVIEKAFQAGGKSLRQRNIRVEALASIASLENDTITFTEQEATH
ncbi:xanthine phosphoribosyltransferase [Salimicrobium halophilum]|uniref:Xanthine phosphoribosyltransferase n=1 Tax=Salimicrobium halophilum TaxID=86666 RepID=A0A1G8S5J8_9BACI|nr:xanthine phosphoribosyltransferase [Salimicrobium halophilum]SDJ24457.1 xanthine phosphoribosyltransferase [Salimicrobium halophilum]